MGDVEWLRKRNRGIHMTIRDVDCEDFDAEAMAREFARLKVTFFSFFCGGYVTTYPTDLDLQRVSPWLGSQDITGQIVDAAHRHGIKAFPMIDLGALPNAAFEAHPEWASRNADGSPRRATPYTYSSCPMGGWVREYSREMVREICERYDVDGMKFGGGSYGFGRDVCHCEACREGYRQATGEDLPSERDWSDPDWRRYIHWREEQTVECVAELVEMVHSIRPRLPVVGNSVCFGDPGWTVNSSLDIERLAELEDIVQVEIQTRFWFGPDGGGGHWQYLRWPAETANYMSTVSDRPVWAVASYFVAWPWRRNAAPPVEQKVYLAQVAAHGGHPMVNLSGGPPAVHEDKRGFAAMESLFGFMDEHHELYDGDSSAANVAIVYSQSTLMHYGNDRAGQRYVEDIRGFEQALNMAHIPYDITSTRRLDEESLSSYEVVIVPSMVCMDKATAGRLRAFVEGGGCLIGDFEAGTRDEVGEPREGALLSDLLAFEDSGQTEMVCGEGNSGPRQGYMRVHPGHPLTAGLEVVELVLMTGAYRRVRAADGAEVPLTLAAPFRLFPEGLSYPEEPDPGHPMAVVSEKPGGGRTIYFAPQIGKYFFLTRFPDLARLITNAVRWGFDGPAPLEAQAPASLHTSLRRNGDRLLVHCVNLTGGERFFTEIVPLHDCTFRVRMPEEWTSAEAWQASSGRRLTVRREGGFAGVTVPVLEDYDIIAFEKD